MDRVPGAIDPGDLVGEEFRNRSDARDPDEDAHHDERRQRKLLLHRHEIQKLTGKVKEKGLTLVPLQMYFKTGRVKVALALVKGKQQHDKRAAKRQQDDQREIDRAIAHKNKR